MSASKHATCPICHSDHTLGDRCDCQQVEIRADLLPRHESELLARTVLKATAKAFEDPAVRADYDRWKAERQQKATAE